MGESTYFFENAWPEERARIAALESALDPGTQELLGEHGLPPGLRCAEVGAGGGSIAAWLADHEGVHVLATDIQTSFLEPLARQDLEVRHHDLSVEPLPEQAFDLVHIRWMLFWLSPEARATAWDHLVGALRPGGRLVVEEPDFVTMVEALGVPEPLATVNRAHVEFVRQISGDVDPRYGSRVVRDACAHGLRDVVSRGRTHVIRPDEPATGSDWLRLALRRVRDPLVSSGACAEDQYDEALRQFDDPSSALPFPLTMAVSGQR